MKKLSKKNYKKIGVLGGTFDPPHKGHLYISKIALKKLKLDKIIWVITKRNPLKRRPYLSKKARIQKSKLITKNEKKIIVRYYDDIVKSINTYNLLQYIKKKNKKSKLFFLMGSDNLAKFHKWYNWVKIPKIAKIAVFPRKNYTNKSINQIVSKRLNKRDFIRINSKLINISSSLIRKFW